MPTFDFKCPSCGAQREVFLKKAPVEPSDLPPCKECSTPMEKQVSAPGGFKFNGGGYYETDFKHKR